MAYLRNSVAFLKIDFFPQKGIIHNNNNTNNRFATKQPHETNISYAIFN